MELERIKTVAGTTARTVMTLSLLTGVSGTSIVLYQAAENYKKDRELATSLTQQEGQILSSGTTASRGDVFSHMPQATRLAFSAQGTIVSDNGPVHTTVVWGGSNPSLSQIEVKTAPLPRHGHLKVGMRYAKDQMTSRPALGRYNIGARFDDAVDWAERGMIQVLGFPSAEIVYGDAGKEAKAGIPKLSPLVMDAQALQMPMGNDALELPPEAKATLNKALGIKAAKAEVVRHAAPAKKMQTAKVAKKVDALGDFMRSKGLVKTSSPGAKKVAIAAPVPKEKPHVPGSKKAPVRQVRYHLVPGSK